MNATAELPAINEGAPSVPDLCLKRMRAILAPYLAPERRVEPGAALWVLLNDGERKFLLRMAKLDAVLAESSWRDLNDSAQTDVLAAWQRLAEWVGRIGQHLDRVGRR